MITSLLIANRGEIACRIIRTARAMGIRTVAVYSDADANALHVRQADEAVHIGPSPARESYLVGDKIIAAAHATGAEAIHPGYGFLSENADFAQAVIDAGLIWVGPKPDSIRAMGLKDAAKARMIAAGVPVTPGYLGEDQSAERLQAEADAIGYPVLIKAVAGGGGKGMRRVDAAQQFAEMLQSCKREAASSFGDDHVLLEKYILSPRHIEVQVFGDSHGNVVHLFERDCSLQRRHQKVIEEAPAPGMDEATREAICAAAVRAAKAVDYVGAGTIEFIADASQGLRADRIWFMEMNTRLQVEHPVTEEITGQDLVEWQLRVASGEPLPMQQEELSINGWALEARLYAEEPASGFLPSTGRLNLLELPEDVLRVETGVEQGDAVTPFYDPMIAKLVASGEDRDEAMLTLATGLFALRVWPVKTNAAFLLACLNDADFRGGSATTGLIAARGEALSAISGPGENEWKVAAMALFAPYYATGETAGASPWAAAFGFRLNADPGPRITVQHGSERRAMLLETCVDATGFATPVEGGVLAYRDAQPFLFTVPAFTAGQSAVADGALLAPMPGRITSVEVTAGSAVVKGQRLITLEAMKMEHGLVAPFDGEIAELHAQTGAHVSEGSLLVRVEKGE
ncbi:ATP-grasp domain-containing protein [Sphingomonas psychrotolerans]|uniref:ATP-grasp domain-containing protein n=1 Tax=Sphingomonas psychrotolerans TaxID=1327635 RepID=A0ABU3MZL9_9SPHN|nr:biotin carboxylase N-terminal domain-containing protein [Sphingomonas psychrotolerans]MDT8757568.1 ATP-grasp domain-containing protein [Sphingomonas psychrotolerans]